MGISSISPGSLLLILLIVLVLFGAKRLRTLGEDLGVALHGLRKGIKEEQVSEAEKTESRHENIKD